MYRLVARSTWWWWVTQSPAEGLHYWCTPRSQHWANVSGRYTSTKAMLPSREILTHWKSGLSETSQSSTNGITEFCTCGGITSRTRACWEVAWQERTWRCCWTSSWTKKGNAIIHCIRQSTTGRSREVLPLHSVLCPDLGPPVQEGQGHARDGPKKLHERDQGSEVPILWGWAGTVQPRKENLQGEFLQPMCISLRRYTPRGQSQALFGGAQCQDKGTDTNWNRSLPLNTRETLLYWVGNRALAQAAQRLCSQLLGDLQKMHGHVHGQPAVGGPAWAGLGPEQHRDPCQFQHFCSVLHFC